MNEEQELNELWSSLSVEDKWTLLDKALPKTWALNPHQHAYYLRNREKRQASQREYARRKRAKMLEAR